MENGGRSREVFITVTATFVLASIFAASRVISRFCIVKRHAWDDYTFILACGSWLEHETDQPMIRSSPLG